MEELLKMDTDLLLFFNSLHADWLDPVAIIVTKTEAWIPLYLFLVYLLIRNYKKEAWMPVVGIAVTILLADQITSGLMKPYFARLRPSQEPALQGLIHLVNGYKGGSFSFASSHAANTLGTATFFWLFFRSQYRWIWLLFIWAFIMTYTRLYLGVHYPTDILVGGIIGILSGWAGYSLAQWLLKKYGQTLCRKSSTILTAYQAF
jgi:undecaprenyl-diphosphatase